MVTPEIRGPYILAFCAALLAVAACDLHRRRIPNFLVLPFAFAGVMHAFLLEGLAGAAASGLGLFFGAMLLLLQFHYGLMGAGDVKLLGAIGAWTGAKGALVVMLVGSLLGGVLSLLAMVRLPRSERAQIGHNLLAIPLLRKMSLPEPTELSRRHGIPYGLALCAAALAFVLMGVGR